MPTEETWIYDLRTNTEKITKRKPLTASYFESFEKSYGNDPNGHPKTKRLETDRFKRFTRKQLTERDYNLDIFWLKDDSLEDSHRVAEPEDLVTAAIDNLQVAMDELNDVMLILQDVNGKKEEQANHMKARN